MSRSRWGRLLLLASYCALPACQLSPQGKPEGKDSESSEYRPLTPLYIDPVYADRAPANVAILTIRDTVGLTPEQKTHLRQTVYDILMRKGYAALDLTFVEQLEKSQALKPDANLSVLKNTFPAQGYLVCSFSLLDSKVYQDTKQIVVQGRVTLYGSGTGSTLFDWELKRQLKPATENGTVRPGQTIEEAAAERFLAACLDQLPARQSKP
jgi:hypothetical protein